MTVSPRKPSRSKTLRKLIREYTLIGWRHPDIAPRIVERSVQRSSGPHQVGPHIVAAFLTPDGWELYFETFWVIEQKTGRSFWHSDDTDPNFPYMTGDMIAWMPTPAASIYEDDA